MSLQDSTWYTAAGPGNSAWAAADLRVAATGPSTLTPIERRAAAAFRLESRRRTFLAGRAAAHRALIMLDGSLADAAKARRLSVVAAPDGAPDAWLDGSPLPLSVSIAHRGSRVVAAASRLPVIVGIDVERVEPRTPSFVSDFLTATEASAVAASTDPDLSANLAWCAKEAVLKVRRTGLRRDTRSVEVALEPTAAIAEGAWQPLSVRDLVIPGRLEAWWRRDGEFVTAIALGISPAA